MKKNKGFTLVELLAILVVLAILALIAVPQILKIVESSNKGSFGDSAIGLMESAELYYTKYAGQQLELDLSNQDLLKELNFKGKAPDGGTLYIDKEGFMAIKMYNKKYCAYKKINDDEVTVKDGNCDDIDVSIENTTPVTPPGGVS